MTIIRRCANLHPTNTLINSVDARTKSRNPRANPRARLAQHGWCQSGARERGVKRLHTLPPPFCRGFTYLQSMDFQREPQSKHHLYCEQEKPAHCLGSLLLRLGAHQIQNRTRDAHKISPHGTMTKRTPAMNWDHAVSWGGGLG